MNNDKAIALLRRMQEPEAYEPQITAEAFEALGMAIKALERVSFPQAHENDLISRKAAIDFIDAGHLVNPNEPRWSDNEVVAFLRSRPPAQSELANNSPKLANDSGKKNPMETIKISIMPSGEIYG